MQIDTRLIAGIFLIAFLLAVGFVTGQVMTPQPEQTKVLGEEKGKSSDCITIQGGTLETTDGRTITTGYDDYGYNYQAHLFNGSYANVYLGRDGLPPYEGNDEEYLTNHPEVVNKWYWPYRKVELLMKWDDNWLANKDCDGDDLLDRHYGHDTYIGSGAWETNHQSETYELDGKACKWNYFVKIVAAPDNAEQENGIWYTSNGAEIGPVIWSQFAIVQQVYNDPCEGAHGVEYLSPAGPGFGKWK